MIPGDWPDDVIEGLQEARARILVATFLPSPDKVARSSSFDKHIPSA
jgi:hypothetical protein